MTSPRRHSPSPARKAPLEDDDLLSEILLRLPPQPSSLPRVSLVSPRWRRLVSDPAFLRRFRAHHRRGAPILGVFTDNLGSLSFLSTLEPPDRFPRERFTLRFGADDRFILLGCRHGLVLVSDYTHSQVLVWDPVTGRQHRIAFPPGLGEEDTAAAISGSVLLAAASDTHFQVVLVGTNKEGTLAVACVYSSETGAWGNLVSTPLPPTAHPYPVIVDTGIPGALVGHSLYWLLEVTSSSILEFDLKTHALAVVPVPLDMYAEGNWNFWVMRAEGGGLGFLFMSGYDAQFWKRTTDSDGHVSWGLVKTIEMHKLLSLDSDFFCIIGFAEDNNVVVVWAGSGVVMVHLDSLKFKKLFESNIVQLQQYRPFSGVYTADTGIGGGHDGADLLDNA